MKTIILLIVLALPAASADVSGTWNVEASADGHNAAPVCVFKQLENRLSGVCKYDNISSDLTGEVKDKEVTWKYDTTYEGEPITVTFFGRLDTETTMKGSLQVAPGAVQGEFSAKKQ